MALKTTFIPKRRPDSRNEGRKTKGESILCSETSMRSSGTLSETEQKEFQAMNIPLSDVDEILSTPYGIIVSTGDKRWMEKRLGKRQLDFAQLAQLKKDYNEVLRKLRVLESGMTKEDIPAHEALMTKLAKIYERIVWGGYAISPEETQNGF